MRLAGGVFALSSLLTPFFLGTVVGAVVTGRVHDAGDPVTSWANPASLLTGALFVAVSAYLAAVYLTVDSERDGEPDMRSYFIRRALAAAVASGGLAAVTLAVLHTTARPVFAELPGRTSWTAEVISHAAGIISTICRALTGVGTVARVTSDSGGSRSSGPYYAADPGTAPFPGLGSRPPGRGPVHHGREPGRHGKPRKLLIATAIGALAVVTAIAAVIIVVVMPGNSHTTGFVPTGSTPGEDARQITTAFLQAWQSNDLGAAGRLTDHPAAAESALSANKKYLHLKKLTATTGSAAKASGSTSARPRETVTYAVTAKVASSDSATAMSGNWGYRSSLVAYQQRNSGAWYIAWAPDVVAPNLTTTTHLAAVQVAPQVVAVADSSGKGLSSYNDPGLTTIAGLLKQKAPAGQGSPGLDVEIQDSKGNAVPSSQAVVIAPTNIPSLNTSIDPTAESAARSAVGTHKNSSMVVIQPSTGKILAIANNAGFNDFALTAQVAPGSTMKIITSTALINEGAVTANSGVACPQAYTVQGITYHNDNNESEPASASLTTDFAQSCNNAFDRWWQDLAGGRLASTAKEYYGLNRSWDIGITGLSAPYFNAPASASGSELAQEAFGEGQLSASPLAMASVVATVEAGTFRQPYLVQGARQVTATALPSGTDAQLKQMMRAVVTGGTAAGIGFGPDVYAKTGTADIVGQQQPNSWLVAFDPSKDVAIACLVVNAGYGAQFAGPEVKSFLDNY